MVDIILKAKKLSLERSEEQEKVKKHKQAAQKRIKHNKERFNIKHVDYGNYGTDKVKDGRLHKQSLSLKDLKVFKDLPKEEKLLYLYKQTKRNSNFELFYRSILKDYISSAPTYPLVSNANTCIPRYYEANIEFLPDWKHFIKCYDIGRHYRAADELDIATVISNPFAGGAYVYIYEGVLYKSKKELVDSGVIPDTNNLLLYKELQELNISFPVFVDYFNYKNNFGYYNLENNTVYQTLNDIFLEASGGDDKFFLKIKPTELRLLTMEEIQLGIKHIKEVIPKSEYTKRSLRFKKKTYETLEEAITASGTKLSYDEVTKRLEAGYDLTSALVLPKGYKEKYSPINYHGNTYADARHLAYKLKLSYTNLSTINNRLNKLLSPTLVKELGWGYCVEILREYYKELNLDPSEHGGIDGVPQVVDWRGTIATTTKDGYKTLGMYSEVQYIEVRSRLGSRTGKLLDYIYNRKAIKKRELYNYYMAEFPERVYLDTEERRFVFIKNKEGYLKETYKKEDVLIRFTGQQLDSTTYKNMNRDLDETIVYKLTLKDFITSTLLRDGYITDITDK